MEHLYPRGAFTETGATMKPLPNLLFVKTVAEIQEDGMTKVRLSRFINDQPAFNRKPLFTARNEDQITIASCKKWLSVNATHCAHCGSLTAGERVCGFCASEYTEDNAENLPTAR